jgi:hypothetical protein
MSSMKTNFNVVLYKGKTLGNFRSAYLFHVAHHNDSAIVFRQVFNSLFEEPSGCRQRI